MSNRMNMLQFTLDDSDQEESAHPGIIPADKFTHDRFQSKTVERGLFFRQDEDEEYQNLPVARLPREPSKKEKQKVNIKMLNEIDYDQEEIKAQKQQPQEKKGNQIKNEQMPTQGEIKSQPIKAPEEQITRAPLFTHKMLEIALSDDSDSDTGGREDEEENQRSDDQDQQENVKSPPHAQKTLESWESSSIFEGVTDPQSFLRRFCKEPVPLGKFLHLTIIRKSSGLNSFWPEFQVVFASDKPQILYAKKMMGSTTSNFYITTEAGVERIDHPSFLAKMRGNFAGSVYQVFDNGVNPQKASKISKARTLLATIKFKSQVQTMEPRSFEVFLLNDGVAYEELYGFIPMKEIGLDILYQNELNKGKIMRLMNRKPVYSEAFKGYILNFSGRVQKPSIKNFILEDIDGDKREVMMLGKLNDDLFRLDVSHPMQPYMALCISLANFDSKYLSD